MNARAVFPLIALIVARWASAATAIVFVHDDRVGRCDSWACVRDHRPIEYAWAWTDAVRVPVRMVDADLNAKDDALDRRIETLPTHEMTVALKSGSQRLPDEMTLIAAPKTMWAEIPEADLPRYAIEPRKGMTTIAVSDAEGSWRVRAAGRGVGSWWAESSKETVRLQLHAASDRTIAIVEEGGAPAAAAELAINDASRGTREHQTFARYVASVKGVIRLPAIPGDTDVMLVAFDRAHLGDSFEGRIPDAPARLILKAGVRINGKVIDGEKRVLAGVTVHYEGWSSADAARAQLLTGTATTAADGAFRIDRVPRSDVLLTFSKDGYAESSVVVKPSSNVWDAGVITLLPGRTVRLHVIDDERKPIADATIKWGRGHSDETDAKGVLTLAGLDDATLKVEATAKGFLPRDCEIPEKAQAGGVTCLLQRAFRARGRYVADGGESSAQLKVSDGARDSFETIAEDGKFDIDLQPDKALQLVFLSVAAAPLVVRVEGKSGEVRDLGDLHAVGGRVVVGRVARPDGEPVSGARIWSPRPAAGGLLVSWATGNVAQTESQEDGTFRISGLPETSCVLRVEAPNAARALVPVDASESESLKDVGTIVVSSGGTVVVRMKDSATQGTAFARPSSSRLDFDAVSTAVSEGTAKLRNVRSGDVHVSVLAPTRIVICQGDVTVSDNDVVDFPCEEERVHVSGDVRVGDQPANGGTLVWASTSETSGPGLIMTNRSAGGLATQQVYGVEAGPIVVPLDASGRFTTDNLAPGEYRVTWSGTHGSATAAQTARIPKADSFAAHLLFSGGTIRGTVVGDDGSPISQATVMELTNHATAVSNERGIFEIHGTPIGACRVQARSGMRSSAVSELNVPAVEAAVVTLHVGDRPERISVHVLTSEGSPASGAFVFASSGAGAVEVVTADVTGSADVAFSSGMPSQARFAVSYANRWSFGRWLGEADLRGGEVSLAIDRDMGGLSVMSERQAGALSIVTADGWNVSTLLTILGSRPSIGPDRPLRLDGLPLGDYVVGVNGKTAIGSVRRGNLTDVRLP